MKSSPFLLLLASSLALLTSGCQNATDSSGSTSGSKSLVVTPRLRAICPTLPAARSSGFPDATSPVALSSDQDTVEVSIFDSTGRYVNGYAYAIQTSQLDHVHIGWNGTDSQGKTLSTGVFFFILSITDPAGLSLRQDTSCIGWVHSSTN